MTLPDTPAGRAAAWFLEHVASKGQNLTTDEIAARMERPAPWTPTDELTRFQNTQVQPFAVEATSSTDHAIVVKLDHGDDRPSAVTIHVSEQPPHRITWVWFGRAMPAGATVREATPSDAAALNDLEIRAPMTLGDGTTITLDRGSDFLAFGRLMDENVTFVAERDGDLLGMACGAAHPTRIGGRDLRVMLLHRIRVPTEHRRGGVFSTLNGYVFGRYDGRTDAPYGYTFVENPEAVRIGGPDAWSLPVFRAVIDCATVAAAGYGRRATPDDAAHIVDVLNCHEREENFLPYTVDSLTARLERAPDLYSWDDVLVADDAVLGVWPSGLGVTTNDERVTRAVVLDHGLLPGAEDSFERLVRAACVDLLERDHQEVTTILSEPAPGWPVVSKLADHIDHYLFRMGVPEPEGTAERGIYVDAVYF